MIDSIIKILDAFLSRVNSLIPLFLAIGSTVGFFSAIGLLAEHQVPAESHDVLLALVGSLGTAWIGVMNYYFGSSSGSKAKTEIMAKNGEKS